MGIRTYYWNTRKMSLVRYYKNRLLTRQNMVFRYGNSGDIFNVDLLKYLYKQEPVNIDNKGNRLMLVGSVMSQIKEGDIISGIGWKGNDLSDKAQIIESANVFGVRGPLTLELFEKYGADLSNLKFLFDPGLLAKEVYNIDVTNNDERQVIFIPHYRDMWTYKEYPKGIKVVSIDNKPKKLLKEISKSKIVYSSSLHGIIFSHALGKECVFVSPQSEEPIFKYRDYYLSIDSELPEPIKHISLIKIGKDKGTVLNKDIGVKDFCFPEKQFLKEKEIIF